MASSKEKKEVTAIEKAQEASAGVPEDEVDPETIIQMHFDGQPHRKYIPVDGAELKEMLDAERAKEKKAITDWLRWLNGACFNTLIKDALNRMLATGKSTLECVCDAIENNTHHEPR